MILTHNARPSTFDVTAVDEHGEPRDVPIAGEHPLTLYVDKQEILTLMTLGAAPEALAIGYLRNQRLVQSLDENFFLEGRQELGQRLGATPGSRREAPQLRQSGRREHRKR